MSVAESRKKLKDLRTGKPPHRRVYISSLDMDVAVVILSADKALEIEENAQEYCAASPKKVNEAVRSQVYNALLVLNCMRDPDNLEVQLAESVNEVMSSLDLEDINRIVNAYGELMMNKAPKLELITEDQIAQLKKVLEVTPLSDLSTVSLVHLANFRQALISSNLLTNSGSGSSSTNK